MRKQPLQLKDNERAAMQAVLAKGSLQARVFKRATGLLELDRGPSLQAVAGTLGVTYNAVAEGRTKYQATGLEAIYDAPRTGRPLEIDGAQRAKLTALACAPEPAGHARWSWSWRADKAVAWGYGEHLSPSYAGVLLKKTNSVRT